MTQALEGKIAVVTGASTGIGLAIAKRFVAEGATVVITGRRQQELDAAVADIGKQATSVRADSSKLPDLDALFETVKQRHGHIDILVANAGGGTMAPLGKISEDQFDQTFGINVKGVLFTVQKALPLLADGAAVILLGSITSIQGTPAFSVYSASKAAIRNFARSWILDLKGRNIRVNVLSPGPTLTPGLTGLVPTEHQQGFLDGIAGRSPLGRIGDPDEIGKVAVFLASDASSYVNGVELFADGGIAQV
jgi:NAD(P)-dependent dehydrogenase (short-subunit alcohol dehydrogenase family)